MKGFPLSSHIFICTWRFVLLWRDVRPQKNPSGVKWHVAPESKIQLVDCELSPNFSLGHLSLPDIRAIYPYIFWSLLFLLLSHARLPFSLKCTFFCCFTLSFGGFGHSAIRWSSDPHLKHFWGVRYVRLLSEASAVRDLSFFLNILLKHFSAEWLVLPQNVQCFWTACAL